MEFVRFKHARFSASFPSSYRYSRSHYWIAPPGRLENPGPEDFWRIGFTKFATRMLGELVEAQFDVAVGSPVNPGQRIGYVEGFKAASDVFCVLEGTFAGKNDALDVDACIVRSSTYVDGWLYAVQGVPEEDHLDVHGYIAHLDAIITRMQEDPQYASDTHGEDP